MKKQVCAVLSLAVGVGVGLGIGYSKIIKMKKSSIDEGNKMHKFYMLQNQWISSRQQGKSLVSYFEEQGYKSIAIYGMKELGECLFDELKDSDIEVKYIIDKNADNIYADVQVVKPDDKLEPVDIVVVTAIYYFDEIEEMLSERIACPIISLEDIVYEV